MGTKESETRKRRASFSTELRSWASLQPAHQILHRAVRACLLKTGTKTKKHIGTFVTPRSMDTKDGWFLDEYVISTCHKQFRLT